MVWDNQRLTPLRLACILKSANIATTLIKAGADPDLSCGNPAIPLLLEFERDDEAFSCVSPGSLGGRSKCDRDVAREQLASHGLFRLS